MKYKNIFFLIEVFLLFFVSFFLINFKDEIQENDFVEEENVVRKEDKKSELGKLVEKKTDLIEVEKKTKEKITSKRKKTYIKRKRVYSDSEWKYIFGLAELRGYKKRNEVSWDSLVKIDGIYIFKDVIGDYEKIKNELSKYNVKLNFISGFRSVKDQKRIFENKLNKIKIKKGDILNGKSDNLILKILETSSAPGYSKHHTGKALDFSCGNYYYLNNSFKNTNCYRWLSANNFENSKKYNFYPSYPEGVKKQGPEPEPWEFVWKVKN